MKYKPGDLVKLKIEAIKESEIYAQNNIRESLGCYPPYIVTVKEIIKNSIGGYSYYLYEEIHYGWFEEQIEYQVEDLGSIESRFEVLDL